MGVSDTKISSVLSDTKKCRSSENAHWIIACPRYFGENDLAGSFAPQTGYASSQTKLDKVVCEKHLRQPIYLDKVVSDMALESDRDDWLEAWMHRFPCIVQMG